MLELLQNTWASILKAAAAVGGFIYGLYGGGDTLLTVLLCCMSIDYILGVIVAVLGKSTKTESGGLNSKAGFAGLLKKGVILLAVLLAALLDLAIGAEAHAFRTMACMFYLSNEGISILENAALAGVPFPAAIKTALEQLTQKDEKEERRE